MFDVTVYQYLNNKRCNNVEWFYLSCLPLLSSVNVITEKLLKTLLP